MHFAPLKVTSLPWRYLDFDIWKKFNFVTSRQSVSLLNSDLAMQSFSEYELVFNKCEAAASFCLQIV